MSKVVRISEEVHGRLEAMAVGFDTPGSVIERLIDFYEQNDGYGTATPKPRTRAQGDKKRSSQRGLLPWLKDRVRALPAGEQVDFHALKEEAASEGYKNANLVNGQYIWHVAKAGLVEHAAHGEWRRSTE